MEIRFYCDQTLGELSVGEEHEKDEVRFWVANMIQSEPSIDVLVTVINFRPPDSGRKSVISDARTLTPLPVYAEILPIDSEEYYNPQRLAALLAAMVGDEYFETIHYTTADGLLVFIGDKTLRKYLDSLKE